MAVFAMGIAVGFMARPIGGIILGNLGDRAGASGCWPDHHADGRGHDVIGFLPSYDQIGFWAPCC